jgi:hypothetical protein
MQNYDDMRFWLVAIGALQKPSREIVQFNKRFEFDE